VKYRSEFILVKLKIKLKTAAIDLAACTAQLHDYFGFADTSLVKLILRRSRWNLVTFFSASWKTIAILIAEIQLSISICLPKLLGKQVSRSLDSLDRTN